MQKIYNHYVINGLCCYFRKIKKILIITNNTNKYLSSDLKQILSDFDSLRVELKKKNFKKR